MSCPRTLYANIYSDGWCGNAVETREMADRVVTGSTFRRVGVARIWPKVDHFPYLREPQNT